MSFSGAGDGAAAAGQGELGPLQGSAFLEVGELDMVQATEKALQLLVSYGDYTGAMKVLEGGSGM